MCIRDRIKSAWLSDTLLAKSKSHLILIFLIPLKILIGYMRLSKTDRCLNIESGFIDHRQQEYFQRSNIDDLRRIISAYKAAKHQQSQAVSSFQIHGLWDEWISVNYKELIDALENENFNDLSCIFENIFREQCSIGIGGFYDFKRYKTVLGKFYLKYVWCNYRNILRSIDFDIEKIDFPNVGNQTGILCNGKIISQTTLRHAYQGVEISKLLSDTLQPSIVEIGAGMGGLAQQTISLDEQISKYIIFDIPEVAAISSYFLLSSFPNKKVRLFGEGLVSADASEEYDLAVFPHFSINQLPDLSVAVSYTHLTLPTNREV